MTVVLIVDDEKALRDALSEAVRDLGYEPVVASSGREALAVATKAKPDAIVHFAEHLLDDRFSGADLYDPDQTDAVSTWQPFTTKFIANIHSLTVVDVDASTTTVRQLDANGKELDRFTIAR